MTYVNLTNYDLLIQRQDGVFIALKPSGKPLRITTSSFIRGETPDGIPVTVVRPAPGALAESLERVREYRVGGADYVIVSGIALDWLGPLLSESERGRVLTPDTSPQSANRNRGKIESVKALRQWIPR